MTSAPPLRLVHVAWPALVQPAPLPKVFPALVSHIGVEAVQIDPKLRVKHVLFASIKRFLVVGWGSISLPLPLLADAAITVFYESGTLGCFFATAIHPFLWDVSIVSHNRHMPY